MKKVVRLTERDLSRIVRKVLNESMGNLPEVAIQCALDNFELKDITKIPMECVTVGINVIMTKKLPDLNNPNVIACATKIGKVVLSDKDARQKVMGFAGCVLKGVMDGTITLPIPIPGQDGDGGINVPGTDIKIQIPKFPGMNESRRRRYINEDEMDLSSVNKLGEIEGIDSIPECSTDSESFNSALCLSKAMDTLSFNTFVKEFFPIFQEIANVTKTPLQTTSMDLPNVAESRRRSYRRF